MTEKPTWPDLPLAAWGDTCDTLQLWTQIVGKVRIALTPLVNHWWNATLFVTARGLAAPAMPYDGRTFDVVFDFVDHRLAIETSDIRSRPATARAHLATAGAFYDKGLGQFILPYDVVRASGDPDQLLLGFLQETYAAAAELATWDRKSLERELPATD